MTGLLLEWMDAVDSARLLPPRTGLWEPRSFHTDAGGYLLRQYQTFRGVTNRRYITSWDENGLPELDRKRASLLLQPCWIRTNTLQASVCRIVRVIVFPSRLVLWLDIKFSQILTRGTGHSHQSVWQIEISSAQGSMGIPRLDGDAFRKETVPESASLGSSAPVASARGQPVKQWWAGWVLSLVMVCALLRQRDMYTVYLWPLSGASSGLPHRGAVGQDGLDRGTVEG